MATAINPKNRPKIIQIQVFISAFRDSTYSQIELPMFTIENRMKEMCCDKIFCCIVGPSAPMKYAKYRSFRKTPILDKTKNATTTSISFSIDFIFIIQNNTSFSGRCTKN